MNYVDLFSGIGGFPLGAYWTGMRFDRHYFSEVDPYCVELYQQRFPDAIPLGDIKEIDCVKLMADADRARCEAWRMDGMGATEQEGGLPTSRGGSEWIITGGFPCTDISVAGKGAGIRGQRSGLWSEMWRIIRALQPRFAIIENVSALTFRGLNTVLADLASIGMDAEWQDIRAEDVGAPHRRERIWIVAYPNGCEQGREYLKGRGAEKRATTRGSGQEMAYPERAGYSRGNAGIVGKTEGNSKRGDVVSCCPSAEMADTARQLLDGAGEPGARGRGESTDGGRPALAGLGGRFNDVSKWLDGSWEDGIPRLAHKVPNRVNRLKGDGNAIVPTISQLLFEQIKPLL